MTGAGFLFKVNFAIIPGMKLKSLLLASLILGSTLAQPNLATASGATTNSDNSAGQVRTSNQDGVLYLTTETNTDSQVKNNTGRAFAPMIDLPTGFAENIVILINALLSFVMIIAALLVLMYIIMGAFQWITSGGDKGKIDGAKQKMMAAVIGIIILASSYAISLIVLNFLGFKDFSEVFSSIQTIDGQKGVYSTINSTSATPKPTPSPTPDNYTDNLGDLLN